MCAGHEPSYRYLIGWMAHLLQKPDIKPSVAVVLKSVEGINYVSPVCEVDFVKIQERQLSYLSRAQIDELLQSIKSYPD